MDERIPDTSPPATHPPATAEHPISIEPDPGGPVTSAEQGMKRLSRAAAFVILYLDFPTGEFGPKTDWSTKSPMTENPPRSSIEPFPFEPIPRTLLAKRT